VPLTNKYKFIKITSDFSVEILKAMKLKNNIFQAVKENDYLPRLLYIEKFSFKVDGIIMIYKDKHKQNGSFLVMGTSGKEEG
jgi:hypothetical protein